jgi:hypothetical protein
MDREYLRREVQGDMIRDPSLRYGQAVFNVAYRIWPDAVDTLRGSYEFDPFYNSGRVPVFLDELERRLTSTRSREEAGE